MKKLGLILSVALLGYSALWWGVAKWNAEALAETAESVSISGFPNKFSATLQKPKIKLGNAWLASEEPLTLTRDILGSHYHATLPLNITIRSGPAVLHCQFKTPASMTLNVEPMALEQHLHQSLDTLLKDPKFYEAFRLLEYKDAGATCEDSLNAAHYVYAKNEFTLRNEKREGRNILYVKAGVAKFTPTISGHPYAPYDVAVDVDLDGYDPFLTKEFPENSEMRVNDFSFRNTQYAGKISGYVKVNKTDIFPYGLLKLQLTNYKPMLDDLYATKIHLPNRKKLNTLILKLGNVDANAPDVTIPVVRMRGENLGVGKVQLAEFLKDWKQLFADDHDGRAQ